MSVKLAVLFLLIFPLIPFLLRFTSKKLFKYIPALTIGASSVSLVLSLYLVYAVKSGTNIKYGFNWFEFGNFKISAGFYLDGLSASMLLVVWIVSLAVQIYSLGYMHGDRRFTDFYAILSFFSFSMSGLVISLNVLTTFIFWELVGLCSFLLIGFWYEREAAVKAALKAFLTTRLGDTAFLLGILVLLANFNTLEIPELAHSFGRFSVATSIAALLLFAGAVGKSAQFPLHVWLPDAMEGPTPVSALIHAATMVAAGVYLIARLQFLFVDLNVRAVILAIGLVTALMAATIAIFQRDIKRVLAFSTISQLGYMMTALGAGAFSYGLFHLYSHAFFKALLFLAAGSIFHAIHSLDITDSGGLLKKLKWTGILFLIGALNLAGFPFTGGFFSKESILFALKETGYLWAYYLLLAGAFLTSFYIFKVFFRVFLGEPGKSFEEAHESSAAMVVPMGVLALLSLLVSALSFVDLFNGTIKGHFDLKESVPAVLISLAGILLAYVAYGLRKFELESIPAKLVRVIYDFFYHRMFIDDFYEVFFVRGYVLVSKMISAFDKYVIDGAVNGVAAISTGLGKMIKPIESGFVQAYLFYTLVFFFLLTAFIYLIGGKF